MSSYSLCFLVCQLWAARGVEPAHDGGSCVRRLRYQPFRRWSCWMGKCQSCCMVLFLFYVECRTVYH